MESESLGAFFSILAAISISIRYYFLRKTIHLKGVIYSVFITFLLGALFFIPVSIILNYPNFELPKIGITIFVILGLLEFLIVRCEFEGIRHIGASKTSPIIMGSLLIASLISVLFLGENVEIPHWIGIILLFSGVAIVSYESNKNNQKSGTILSVGIVFPFIAMILIGVAIPLVNLGYSKGVPVTIGLAITQLVALLILTFFSRYKSWNLSNSFNTEERSLYFGVGVSYVVFYLFFYFALSIAPVSVVSPFNGTGPLFVLIVSYLFLKQLEKITKILVVGIILTVLGAVLVGVFM